jgi:choline dehydrogenase
LGFRDDAAGSSSINAMCAVRGPIADFDAWAPYGGEAWGWTALAPLMEKVCAVGDDPDPGRLAISPLRYRHPISKAFVAAAREAGYPGLDDFNAECPDGVGFYPVFQREGERWENARAFLDPARERGNLEILADTRVLEVEFDGARRAKGVRIRRHDGSIQSIGAQREVILAAGAVGSPHLLLLSGIGPHEELRAFGIGVRHELPGVGRNLQDHLDVTVVCYASGGGLSARPHELPARARAIREYAKKRKGPFTSNLAEAGGFIRSRPDLDRPDLQLHFLPAVQQDHGRKLVRTVLLPGCALHVCGLYPKSRGRIGLDAADPSAAPRIDPRYLSDETDLEVLKAGLARVFDILRQPALAAYRPRPFIPRRFPEADHEFDELVRSRAETIYHPVGTCRMGTDKEAVVDSGLKVHGIENLRVADASVMPTLIGANTNIATTLIAEKAADLILGG